MAHSTGLYVEFGENADIKIRVSWHVECVVLMSRVNPEKEIRKVMIFKAYSSAIVKRYQ